MNEDNTLYIPVNIKTRFEFFNGFGFSELTVTLIYTAISIVIAFFVHAITQDINKSVLLVLITATATGMAVKKSDINQSITDLIILYFKFVKSQQRFKYEYHNKFTHKEA